jgi:hypothetical protein
MFGFDDSSPSLTMICRHDDHGDLYKERCARLGISMNSRALPKDDNQTLSRQGTLNDAIVVQSRVPPFTAAGLLDYIVELVVCEDEVRTYLQLRYIHI